LVVDIRLGHRLPPHKLRSETFSDPFCKSPDFNNAIGWLVKYEAFLLDIKQEVEVDADIGQELGDE